MRTIGVVTVGRSDYGIYVPILRRIQSDPDLSLRLIVAGMHLSPEFGLTANAIECDGFPIWERVEMLLSSDSPAAIAKSMGLGTIGFAQSYARSRPDILVVLGDRFEMFAAALAALPFTIPVAHIHGGELTEGALDDALRHSMTKLSHLHFVSTREYRKRVEQLGEEPWRVTVSGAPSLDNLSSLRLLTASELEVQHGLTLERPPLLVTFHPVTLAYEQAARHTTALLEAIEASRLPAVFTLGNADTHGRVVIQLIREFVGKYAGAQLVENLGTQAYFSVMSLAAAMVGNSSSGIIEAASFHLPVVNIGHRQRGRMRAKNVVDVGDTREQILAGITKALSAEFRATLSDLVNPYGDGRASERIVERLKAVKLDDALVWKRFHEI